MKPEDRLKELGAQAEVLRRKAVDTPDAFTEADADQATAIATEYASVNAIVERGKATSAALAKAGAGVISQSGEPVPGAGPAFGRKSFNGRGGGVAVSQSERTGPYTAQIMKALEAAAPAIGGPFVQKSLIPSGSVTADFDGRAINDPMATFSIFAAVNSRQVDGPAGTYLRQTERTNNAAPVVAGELKPISVYALEPATWSIATIAHVTEPIKLQWLDDYPVLEQFLAHELAYGVDAAISDFILNGGDAEDGSTVTGLLNTSGIVQTSFNTSKILTIRKAIGELDTAGVTATGIIMNSQDWESIETLTTVGQEFLLPPAPQRSAERLLWGTPVTLAPGMPAGEAIIGDLSTVSLLYRNSQTITWNPYASDTGVEGTPAFVDHFRRNQCVFRAEARVGLEILSTKTLRVADLTA
jgi:HK97 family phage major capsid protein